MANKMKAEPVSMVVRGRLAFVNVFTPRPGMNGGEPKFSVNIMIPKKDPQVKKIQEVISKLKRDEWGPGADKKPVTVYKTIFRDGDDEMADKYPEFAGHMFMNASSSSRPGLVNLEMIPILSKEDIYSGVDAQVQVNFYTYENKSKGVSAGLNNIRVLQKLEAFTNREKAEEVAWGEVPADVVAATSEASGESEEDPLS